jgi:hypothetical protein
MTCIFCTMEAVMMAQRARSQPAAGNRPPFQVCAQHAHELALTNYDVWPMPAEVAATETAPKAVPDVKAKGA